MRRHIYIYLFFSSILCFTPLYAQTVLDKSENIRPQWLRSAPPKSGATFQYYITEAENETLTKSKNDCLIDLAERVGKDQHFSGATYTTGQLDQVKGQETYYLEYHFKLEGQKKRIVYKKLDDYWEYIIYNNGRSGYRCYTLYTVAKNPDAPVFFDEVTFTRQYGMRGLTRSVIPGFGQLYKGEKVKGLCIMGGEVLLLGSALVFENMRADYIKKTRQTQNVTHIRTYSNKAGNCSTFRNVALGGAAALYIYNLVDALVSPGAKRTLVKKNRLVFTPVSSPEMNGIYIAFNF